LCWCLSDRCASFLHQISTHTVRSAIAATAELLVRYILRPEENSRAENKHEGLKAAETANYSCRSPLFTTIAGNEKNKQQQSDIVILVTCMAVSCLE